MVEQERYITYSCLDDQGSKIESYDKVLVKNKIAKSDEIDSRWQCTFFSHFDSGMVWHTPLNMLGTFGSVFIEHEERPFITVSGAFAECIKYEGNEHLVGTDERIITSYKDYETND